ncbi:MAG: TetR/AcrR family transcriptional regulator [Pseudomonadota bacterium]
MPRKRAAARQEQILRAAKRIFAEKGFYEATISDIAREAQLSEPTIYEYFASKEDLLFSIPAETSRRIKEFFDVNLGMFRGAVNKLRGIIYSLFWLHQNDPDYAAVSYLILRQSRKYMETESYEALRQRLRPLYDVIEEGLASGEFRRDFSPFFIRSVVLGAIEHLVTRKLLTGSQDNLIDYVDSLTDLVTGGICPPPETGPAIRLVIEQALPAAFPEIKPPPGAAEKESAKSRKGKKSPA